MIPGLNVATWQILASVQSSKRCKRGELAICKLSVGVNASADGCWTRDDLATRPGRAGPPSHWDSWYMQQAAATCRANVQMNSGMIDARDLWWIKVRLLITQLSIVRSSALWNSQNGGSLARQSKGCIDEVCGNAESAPNWAKISSDMIFSAHKSFQKRKIEGEKKLGNFFDSA